VGIIQFTLPNVARNKNEAIWEGRTTAEMEASVESLRKALAAAMESAQMTMRECEKLFEDDRSKERKGRRESGERYPTFL